MPHLNLYFNNNTASEQTELTRTVEKEKWYRKWVDETSFHGIKDIVDAHSCTARLIWIVIVIFMLGTTVYQSWSVVDDYIQGKTLTSTSFERLVTDADQLQPYLQFLYCAIDDWLDIDKVRATGISDPAIALAIGLFETRSKRPEWNYDIDKPYAMLGRFAMSMDSTWATQELGNPMWDTLQSFERENALVEYFNVKSNYLKVAADLQTFLANNNYVTVNQFLLNHAKSHRYVEPDTKTYGYVIRYGRMCEHIGYIGTIDRSTYDYRFMFTYDCSFAPRATISPYYQNDIPDPLSRALISEMETQEVELKGSSMTDYELEITEYELLSRSNAPCFDNSATAVKPLDTSMYLVCYGACMNKMHCFTAGSTNCLLERPFFKESTAAESLYMGNKTYCMAQCNRTADMPCSSVSLSLRVKTKDTYLGCGSNVGERFIYLSLPAAKTTVEEYLVMTWPNMLGQLGGLFGLFLGASLLSFIQFVLSAIFGCSCPRRKIKGQERQCNTSTSITTATQGQTIW